MLQSLFLRQGAILSRQTRVARRWESTLRSQPKANAHPFQSLRNLRWISAVGLFTCVATTYIWFTPVTLDARPVTKTQTRSPSKHAARMIPYEEVQKHNTRESCWVIVEGQVYDATSILNNHPGGRSVLLKNAGKDATKAFVQAHPPGTLAKLPPEAHIGPVDPATVPNLSERLTEEEKRIARVRAELPPPAAALNLGDIEEYAQKVLTSTAWAYYRSDAEDGNSFRENRAAFKRFWFRPRVLNKVSKVSTATTILSNPSSLPIYISPAALGRLGHPDGEMNFVRAAGKAGILQGISNMASCSIDEIVSARLPGQPLLFQLYLNRDRSISENLIKRADYEGFKAIIVTVDAPVSGKRELDQRSKGEFVGDSPTGGLGVSHAISGHLDADLSWDDITWIKSLTKLPLIVKGIQCVEDVEKAFEYGAEGVIISNHGGRSLDFSPAPMTVLYELHRRRPDLLRKHEVYIDGGVTRGTDVLKALCLGARAVGLGRAFLYANGVWGEAGCSRVIDIMREEIETSMRLLGVTSIDQLTPALIQHVDQNRRLYETDKLDTQAGMPTY